LLSLRLSFLPNQAQTITVKVQLSGQPITSVDFPLSAAQFGLPYEAYLPNINK